MDTLLEEFDSVIRGADGETYRVLLHGRSRPRDTWQGWLVFERLRDRQRVETGVETTQPNREAVLYWATGLTDAYLDGALRRALEGRSPTNEAIAAPEPLVGRGVDAAEHARRRNTLEHDILHAFALTRSSRMLARDLFAALPHARADIIRALEHMEKHDRMLVRTTDNGNDWLVLTASGVAAAGLEDVPSRPASRDR